MGWVKSKLIDEPQLLPQLGDEMRDSIGSAVTEFNEGMGNLSDASIKHIVAKDCTARGKYCRRASKAFGRVSIEVFLDESEKALKTCQGADEPEIRVCGYRISSNRKRAEFLKDTPDGQIPIPTDEACRLALEEFMFRPIVTKTQGHTNI